MIADAGIDKDGVMRRLDAIALHAQNDLAGGRIDVGRLEPLSVFGELLRAQRWKERRRIEERPLLFEDAVNRDGAEGDLRVQEDAPLQRWDCIVAGLLSINRRFIRGCPPLCSSRPHCVCRGQQ